MRLLLWLGLALPPAAPAVQDTFGTPERFLDVMRMAYRAVYRPARLSFLEPMVMGG